jgi:hypothetical protein
MPDARHPIFAVGPPPRPATRPPGMISYTPGRGANHFVALPTAKENPLGLANGQPFPSLGSRAAADSGSEVPVVNIPHPNDTATRYRRR